MLRCCCCSAAPASQMERSIASLSSVTMPAFFFFVLFLFPAAASRRVLHQPFFPIISQPPAETPAEPPVSSFPKYPSSTNPQQPFFPFFPSPPPPPDSGTPSSSVPTFPANISSLILPHSNSAASPSSRSGKLVPAILLPLLALAFLVLALAFFHRRRRRLVDDKAFRSDAHRLFPADTATSDGRNHSVSSAPASSEFLYLGTLVNSRAAAAEAAPPKPAAPSPAPRIGSPELRPLPPLSRQFRRGYGNADPGCSSEEEFYSPRASSSAGRESPGEHGPCSRRVFIPAVMLERCRPPRSSTLSTPSYPSSNSASSPAPSSPRPCSSPEKSTVKSSDSRSDGGIAEEVIMRSPPPPPPSLPLTPSPPKRKPQSPSPPSSPADKHPGRTRKCADVVSQKLRSPAKIGDFARCPSDIAAPPPPPTPPPPPPAGYWRAKVLPSQPPILVSPRPVALKCVAAFRSAESPRVSDAGESNNEETVPRPKLKPLHWDKVRASSDRVMVWDQLKSSSFQLNEEMIETLFVCNATHTAPKETARRQVLPPPNLESKVLDPKKSQNIAILLRALNVTKEEVCEALLEGNVDSLDAELLETLLKMAPTKEEERKLKEYKDDSPFKLGPAEKFLKAVLDIPFAFKRVDAMLYIANFDSEVNYLKRSFETLEAACDELRSSRMFLKLLEAVLKTGNRMNVGTNRGDAHAFKLDTLLKLVDVKGTDGKTTLLHFVVQEIIRSEGSRLAAANHPAQPSSRNQTCTLREDLECKKLGLQIVAGLGGELSNVKKAATMDSEVLSSSVSKLAGGVGRVGEVVRLNGSLGSPASNRRLHEAMSEFLKKAEDDIIKIQAQESVASSLVKEITEYFHGNSAKEEAHPFRIFMVVRDFLSILDQVCKEVGKINERTFVSSARQFPVPVNPTLPPVFPRLRPHTAGSSDDDGESSSSSSSQ